MQPWDLQRNMLRNIRQLSLRSILQESVVELIHYKENSQYDIDDIILSEYGTTVVGLEMMRSVNEENEEETRKKNRL